MISTTKLLFSYYKIIISFVTIIPIIFLIHGIYKSSRKKIIISVVALIILFGLFSTSSNQQISNSNTTKK